MRRIGALTMAAFVPALACGQSFWFGVKAGVPITEYFQTGIVYFHPIGSYTNYSAATRRYTLGVSAEWRHSQALGFEADALYKRMGYVAFDFAIRELAAVDVKGNSWEFPLLAKYRFRRRLHPYVAAGGVFRYIGPVRGRGQRFEMSPNNSKTATPIDTIHPAELDERSFAGTVGAGGIELRAGRFRLLPEIRYTRWMTNLSNPYSSALSFKSNQVEVLVGFLF